MNPKQIIQKSLLAGQLEEARGLIKQYEAEMYSDPDFFSIQASLALLENNEEEAQRLILRGLKYDPKHPDLLYHLAYVYRAKGEDLEAYRLYQKALEHVTTEEIKNLILQDLATIQEHIPVYDQRIALEPMVSIIVLAYNNLEYTKLCVQSILQYTSSIKYELILVNNGSSDGTKEFFDSIPQAVKVHLQENVGPVNGFNEGIKVAKGKYTACVCNDFIFTPRWLDNLLTCIESDDSIGFVSPGASFVSNYQSIAGNYSNIEEMLSFAEQYNHSNPRKWEERVRLLPCVLMVRTFLLKEIGGYDPRFYFGEFADDDISFQIRRKGYKMLYCKDTFTHHFGSVTTREDQIHNNSLGVSRNIFLEKHGMDAWEDASFTIQMVQSLSQFASAREARILGINAKCGGNPLQLKNYLREQGLDRITITNYCIDEKYQLDLQTVSDRVVCGSLKNLQDRLTDETYHFIILEHQSGLLDQYPKLLNEIGTLLVDGGHLAVRLQNAKVDEKVMKAAATSLQKYGYEVQYQQFLQNVSNGHDLILIGQRSHSS